MLKLPKNVMTHPKVAVLETLFGRDMRRLHAKGSLEVPVWPLDATLRSALVAVFGTKHLVQGLESIEKSMDREQKGLKALKEKPGQTQNQRFSRLVLLSNDGSERFYNSAESLLTRHSDRILGCIVDASAEVLGHSFTAKANPAKALMIDDRKALEAFLAMLADGS